jgi:BASS family bile acid:Na+ symporter
VAFWTSFVTILGRVIPIIVLPFAASLLLRKFAPRWADGVQRLGRVSFYLWLAALAIVTARVVNFVATRSDLSLSRGLWLAGAALIICLVQFMAGKWIGSRWGETTAGGQALGQKNTILAIWLAQTYLNPLSSIAPAAYVLWQNIFNSVQLWLTSRKK